MHIAVQLCPRSYTMRFLPVGRVLFALLVVAAVLDLVDVVGVTECSRGGDLQ